MDDDVKSMERYSHSILAEESISNYISLLEQDAEAPMPDEDKEWLYKKGKEIFDKYYTHYKLDIVVATARDNKKLTEYINSLQEKMSRMYAHILVSEFKLYILEKRIRGE